MLLASVWVEARDAVNQVTIHRSACTMKNGLPQGVNIVEVGKPCCRALNGKVGEKLSKTKGINKESLVHKPKHSSYCTFKVIHISSCGWLEKSIMLLFA